MDLLNTALSNALDHVKLHFGDSGEAIGEFFTWLGERHEENAIGFDTETTGLSAHTGDRVRLIQVGDTMHGWVFPEEWHGAALQALRDWDGDLVAHNAKFDVNFLRNQYPSKLYEPKWSKIHDTMTAAHLDDPTRSRGLKPLAGMLIDPRAASSQVVLEKEMNLNNWDWATVPFVHEGVGSSYAIYAALDPVLTCRLHQHFKSTREQYRKAYELEMGTVRCIADMERKGVRVDTEYCKTMMDKIGHYSQQVRQWARDAHGIENATSTMQCIRRFEALGRQITRFTKSGAPSLDADQLKIFLAEGDLPGNDLAQALLDLRRGEKQSGPYFSNLIAMADNDSRVHPTIWPVGTRTARMSVTQPALQTLPRKDPTVRGAFIPSEENVLIAIDADQIELRLATHLSQDSGLRDAFATGDDFFSVIASEAYNEPVSKSDPRRQLMKNGVYACVPLDTEILTQRGWLRHDQVQIGDQTVGYDWDRRVCQWTEITDVVHYDDAPLMKLYNYGWEMVTTPEHRWVSDTGSTDRVVWTTTETFGSFGKGQRINLAAPFDGGVGLPITDDETRLLGYVLSGRGVKVDSTINGPSQEIGGQYGCISISMMQSEEQHASELLEFMQQFPHEYSVRNNHHIWRIRNEFGRDLIQRIGFYSTDGVRTNPAAFALRLSAKQRTLVFDAIRKSSGKTYTKSNEWSVEFYRTLTHLDGQPTSTSTQHTKLRSKTEKTLYTINRRLPVFTAKRFKREPAGRAPVWCVQTECGTWTMRQGMRSMLTGNTLYGAGTEKIAATAGVPVQAMELVMAHFHNRYPGIRRLQEQITTLAKQRTATEGRPYVYTGMGRKMYGDEGREYALTNYAIQSSAAEILKQGICDLDAVGLGEYLTLPVHDELVLDVPREIHKEVLHTLVETLNAVGKDYLVPLTWGADVMEKTWAQKYLK